MEYSVQSVIADGLTTFSEPQPKVAHLYGLSVQAAIGPKILDGKGFQGRVLVIFSLDLDGMLMDARVTQSSGHQELDRQALNAVSHASFPTPPGSLSPASRRYVSAFTFI